LTWLSWLCARCAEGTWWFDGIAKAKGMTIQLRTLELVSRHSQDQTIEWVTSPFNGKKRKSPHENAMPNKVIVQSFCWMEATIYRLVERYF
jgi:hypothetical protein